jgi:hypothetical protein
MADNNFGSAQHRLGREKDGLDFNFQAMWISTKECFRLATTGQNAEELRPGVSEDVLGKRLAVHICVLTRPSSERRKLTKFTLFNDIGIWQKANMPRYFFNLRRKKAK